MEPLKITQAHDRFFCESMQRLPYIASGFLSLYLPSQIFQCTDLKSLEILKDDWVDEELNEYRADIVFKANQRVSEDSIYFLFEHKSYIDTNTYRQLFGYMNRIWKQIENENHDNKHTEKLPPIIPIIIYHGNNPWNIPNSIKPSFAITKEMYKYVPDFEAVVVDLSVTEISIYLEPVEFRAFLMALKYSRSEHVFDTVSKIIEIFNSQSNQDYLKTILIYLGSLIKAEERELFLSIISKEHKDGESFMKTVADVLREEGFDQGFEQGIKKGIEQGIEKGRKMEREISEKIESDLRLEKEKTQKIETEFREEIQKEHNEITTIVQKLLKISMDIEMIHKITDIPVNKILEIKREIDK